MKRSSSGSAMSGQPKLLVLNKVDLVDKPNAAGACADA